MSGAVEGGSARRIAFRIVAGCAAISGAVGLVLLWVRPV